MPDSDQNLDSMTIGGEKNILDDPNLGLDNGSLQGNGILDNASFNGSGLDMSTISVENPTTINQDVFLDSGDLSKSPKKEVDDMVHVSKYLRLFFIASFLIIISVIIIALEFFFQRYIKFAQMTNMSSDQQNYVNTYKDKLSIVKTRLGKGHKDNYQALNIESDSYLSDVNKIVEATDIDYIDKKDLLSNSMEEIVSTTERKVEDINRIKQEIAEQGFLPEELKQILEGDQAIDTIQRSLNALEVIKFSTASKVFSYMDTSLSILANMVRVGGTSAEDIKNLLTQVTTRGEKDISAYVYMCYLNPYETNSNCDTIGDLDVYYETILGDKDFAENLRLFKNVMNSIDQLLEDEESSLFSITFNGFNAQSKEISFNIEVLTNQSDERSLISQGKRNPNIFIMTNIINLLKQSSYIKGAEIDTKEINVETKTIERGNISAEVSYSSKDFTVPIQKDTEREIFDYIDLDNLVKLIDRSVSGEEDNTNMSEESNMGDNLDLLTEEEDVLDNEDSLDGNDNENENGEDIDNQVSEHEYSESHDSNDTDGMDLDEYTEEDIDQNVDVVEGESDITEI